MKTKVRVRPELALVVSGLCFLAALGLTGLYFNLDGELTKFCKSFSVSISDVNERVTVLNSSVTELGVSITTSINRTEAKLKKDATEIKQLKRQVKDFEARIKLLECKIEKGR
jgi:hypothetical protein